MQQRHTVNWTTTALLASGRILFADDVPEPLAPPDLVFDEVGGIVSVEAEHFHKQTLTDKRAWHITSSKSAPDIKPDADPAHVQDASGGAYLEILPDTRSTHDDKMVPEENFTEIPGALAVAHYKVNIYAPGRFYVWLRTISTGSEDNGVHAGLDGKWPESGRRWQTVNKKAWAWDCKQRTEKVHTGVPMQLFLDIENAGEHEIMFSMREDGFELDKIVLSSSKDFRPEGQGPAVKVKSGTLPVAFPEVTAVAPGPPPFPAHWGEPPAIQTRDFRRLPGGFGEGSSTLAKWIQENLDKDAGANVSSQKLVTAEENAETKLPSDLLDASLSQWETFIGTPHSTVAGLPEGTPMSEDGMKGTPLGLNNDPKKVFSILTEDENVILKVSGEIYGGLTTKKNLSNYHFETEFRWGERKWEPRLEKRRDSGILYHCHGEHGQFWNVWKASIEFQVQEGDLGDYIGLCGVRVKSRSGRDNGGLIHNPTQPWKQRSGLIAARPEADVPHGQWNKLEIYVLGDSAIHVVNGHLVLSIADARNKQGEPLTSGQIQIQSEAAECHYRKMSTSPIKTFPEDLAAMAGLAVTGGIAPGQPKQ